jgi:hypothetical protein
MSAFHPLLTLPPPSFNFPPLLSRLMERMGKHRNIKRWIRGHLFLFAVVTVLAFIAAVLLIGDPRVANDSITMP